MCLCLSPSSQLHLPSTISLLHIEHVRASIVAKVSISCIPYYTINILILIVFCAYIYRISSLNALQVASELSKLWYTDYYYYLVVFSMYIAIDISLLLLYY